MIWAVLLVLLAVTIPPLAIVLGYDPRTPSERARYESPRRRSGPRVRPTYHRVGQPCA